MLGCSGAGKMAVRAAMIAGLLVAGIVLAGAMPRVAQAAVSVSNPRMVLDKDMNSGQVVTWDCVWFGSYPQSEVVPTDTAYASLQAASWNSRGNTTIGGVRYKRLSKSDAVDPHWPSDAADYRYFRYEPIKWRVLSVSGSTAFVVADSGVDGQPYNFNLTEVTWETSSLRSWLNGYGASSNQPGVDYSQAGFIDAAFSAGEKAAILETDVVNDDNINYGTEGGNPTRDKVFLLSESEVSGAKAEHYGFDPSSDSCDEARQCTASDYADAMGAFRDDYDCCWWWLRSPASAEYCAADVAYAGWVVLENGRDVNDCSDVVRPAMNVDLASSCPTSAGTVSSDGAVDEVAPTGSYGSGDGGSGGSAGGGGAAASTMTIGADVSGKVSNEKSLKFFPGKHSLNHAFVPVHFSKSVNPGDGSVTYKVGVGIGREDLLDKESTWNQFKSNVEAAKMGEMRYDMLQKFAQSGTSALFTAQGFKAKPKLGITGYGEFKFDKAGKLLSRAGSVVAEANWAAKANWQFATPIGPVYIQLGGGAKAEAQGGVDFDVPSFKTTFGGTLTLVPNISLEGGYGISSVATVGVQGSAALPIQVAPPTKGDFEAKAALHMYLVFAIDWTYDLAQFKVNLWDTINSGAKGAKALSAASVGGQPDAGADAPEGHSNTGALRGALVAAGSPLLTEVRGFTYGGTFSEVDRSYAADTTPWSGSVVENGAVLSAQSTDQLVGGFSVLQESVMPNTEPLLGQSGGKKVMVFQQNDPGRDTLNSSTLVYSVFDGATWSDPVPVWDTGTLDAYADLQEVGGELYVAWQKEKATLTGDVSSDAQGVLGDIAAGSEICIARFDSASGAFVEQSYVTDNAQLDMMPAIVQGASGVQVAYVRNTENALDQSSGQTQFVVASEEGGSWTESVAGTATEHVSDIVAFEHAGQAEVACTTMDRDASADATAGAVRLVRAGRQVSGEGEQPAGLQWHDGKLYWSTSGVVEAYDCTSGEASALNASILAEGEDASASGAVVGDDVTVLSSGSKTSVVWTETDSEAAESAVYSAVVGGDGALSEPVRLHEGGFGISSSDIVVGEDGAYGMAANIYDAQGTHSLAYASLGLSGNLEPMGASVYHSGDGEAMLTFGVANNSEDDLDGYTVTVKSGSQVLAQTTISASVAPGASDVAELGFDMPEGIGADRLEIEVAPADGSDAREAVGCGATVTTDADLEALVEEVSDSVEDGGQGKSGEQGGGSDSGDNDESDSAIDVDAGGRPDSKTGSSGKSAHEAVKIRKGKTYKVSGMSYKVTKTATAKAKGTVTFAKAKNAKSLIVPATVKLADGRTYKVTAVGAGAFKKLSKVKKVTLGANVATVNAKAFNNMKALTTVVMGKSVKRVKARAFTNTPKLKTITVKSQKLKKKASVKGMLKGSKAKKAITVKVPKKVKMAYKKVFTKANLKSPKKVTVK